MTPSSPITAQVLREQREIDIYARDVLTKSLSVNNHHATVIAIQALDLRIGRAYDRIAELEAAEAKGAADPIAPFYQVLESLADKVPAAPAAGDGEGKAEQSATDGQCAALGVADAPLQNSPHGEQSLHGLHAGPSPSTSLPQPPAVELKSIRFNTDVTINGEHVSAGTDLLATPPAPPLPQGGTERSFDDWICELGEDVIQGEYGYERGEFDVFPAHWRPLFDEGLTPSQAFKRALDAKKPAPAQPEGAHKLAQEALLWTLDADGDACINRNAVVQFFFEQHSETARKRAAELIDLLHKMAAELTRQMGEIERLKADWPNEMPKDKRAFVSALIEGQRINRERAEVAEARADAMKAQIQEGLNLISILHRYVDSDSVRKDLETISQVLRPSQKGESDGN